VVSERDEVFVRNRVEEMFDDQNKRTRSQERTQRWSAGSFEAGRSSRGAVSWAGRVDAVGERGVAVGGGRGFEGRNDTGGG